MEIKEFLYVDVDRTRSLLAQMAGGITKEVRERIVNDLQGRAQAAIFGIGATGQYTRGSQHEEARSLQDLTFVEFERLANGSDLITELGPDVMSADSWLAGDVHRQLTPGQLARIECEVHLLDGSVFQAWIRRYLTLMESITAMKSPVALPSNGGGTSRTARERNSRAADAALTETMGGTSRGTMEAVSSAVGAVVGDSVSMRILACGTNALDCAFTGSLLGRREYLQEERENLFSRYGQAPSTWTAVFQVAAIPEPREIPGEPAYLLNWVNEAGHLNRAAMESDVTRMLDHWEQMGLFEGPRWPSISVTPLGLYRTVPGAA